MSKYPHIMISGAGGMLGSRLIPILQETLPSAKIFSIFHAAPEMGASMHERSAIGDLTDTQFLRDCLDKSQPDVIINLAALTNVERCEEDVESARKINAGIPEQLSLHAPQARLIQLSTDYVFNGAKGNYSPNDSCSPICAYGETKRAAEEIVLQSEVNLVIRTSGVYDWLTSRNLFAYFFRELNEKRTVRALSDCVYSPVWANDLALGVSAAIQNRLNGILHFAGPEALTREQFAYHIAETFELRGKLIKATPQTEFNWLAKRPADSSMDSQAGYSAAGVAAKPVALAFAEMQTEMLAKPSLPTGLD